MASLHRASPLARTVLAFVTIAILCAVTGDIAITTVDPWGEIIRMLRGAVTPDFAATEDLFRALATTIAFALLGVTVGAAAGLMLALGFHRRAVRAGCAVVRAVHELFWALIFLQLFGLSPLTGLLAIAVPFAGIFAKVYAEILEEADRGPLQALPVGTGRLSAFLFVRLPDVWHAVATYTLYRMECGLRSSAILGFVGLPTLGYHLESAFSQGEYSEVAALLLLFYVVIATVRWWMRKPLLPLWFVGALAVLPWATHFSAGNMVGFVTHDIVPYPLRSGDGWAGMADWLAMMLGAQALPGAIATLQLTMVALVASGLLTMLLFPLVSPLLLGRSARGVGHILLVVMRSTPEYILAYILLQLWGPSMLPAIVALALHNGAIVGHLVGRFTEGVALRPDAPRGLDRYAWEVMPRIYRQMLALLFYRWEVILRETAILGMLGIATLGFYIDSAFADLRFDRALFLIAVTAALNLGVDAASRAIRARLRLRTSLNVR